MKRKLDSEDVVAEESSQKKILKDDGGTKNRKKSKMVDREFNTEEISKLKETEALYHSSLFRLQVSELLKEISVKQKLKSRLEEACSFLTNTLQHLPSGKEHKITDRKWLKSKGIKMPLVEKPFQVKGTFQFQPPVDICVCGSLVLDTMVMPNAEADLVLIIPKEFFQPKDYLNQRYTRKRALYLCAVASHLDNQERVEDLKFKYLMGNPHKPALLVKLKGQDSKYVTLCLQAVPEVDSFKESRFHVSKNNIRPGWFSGKVESTKDSDGVEALPATPIYNSSVQIGRAVV